MVGGALIDDGWAAGWQAARFPAEDAELTALYRAEREAVSDL
jgi:hypothetical protein